MPPPRPISAVGPSTARRVCNPTCLQADALTCSPALPPPVFVSSRGRVYMSACRPGLASGPSDPLLPLSPADTCTIRRVHKQTRDVWSWLRSRWERAIEAARRAARGLPTRRGVGVSTGRSHRRGPVLAPCPSATCLRSDVSTSPHADEPTRRLVRLGAARGSPAERVPRGEPFLLSSPRFPDGDGRGTEHETPRSGHRPNPFFLIAPP